MDEFLERARERGVLDCDFLKGKVPHGEYWWCEKFHELTGLPPPITIYECVESCPNNFLSNVKLKNELRIYMGPKHARVPRGAIVKLIAVVNGKMGIFEWNGERYNCPIRILWRIKAMFCHSLPVIKNPSATLRGGFSSNFSLLMMSGGISDSQAKYLFRTNML